jgi:hypothetical protein
MITVLPPVMGPDALDPLSPEAVGGDTRLASQQQIRMSVGGFDGTSGCVGRPGRAGRHAPAVELRPLWNCSIFARAGRIFAEIPDLGARCTVTATL